MTTTQITRLAVQARPATKTAARAALKAAGLRQTLAGDLLAETERLAALRDSADQDRISRHLGYCPVDVSRNYYCRPAHGYGSAATRAPAHGTPSRKPAATLPRGTPAARLAAIRRQTVATTYAGAYRQAAHGDVCIALTTDPAAVGVLQAEYLDYDLYRGAHKGRPARVQNTLITVPSAWRVRVQRAGLAVVDGMMTLDAARIESTGCELYAAVWLVQGRGTSVSAQRGYIARAEGISYHGATADQALSGIAKKRRELALTARLDAADLGELVARCPDARVSAGDALAVGACTYGIRSWCAAVGIEIAHDEASGTLSGSTTLRELYAAYQREPRPEARATITRVLRRHRAAIGA